jgi:alpha-glucosidase
MARPFHQLALVALRSNALGEPVAPKWCKLVRNYFAVIPLCLMPLGDLARSATVSLNSPDGKTLIVLKGEPGPSGVHYFVTRSGFPLIRPSAIDVNVAGAGSLAEISEVTPGKQKSVNETSPLPWGKSKELHNRYNEISVRLKSKSGIEWIIELRAYDDGAAWRYMIPAQKKLAEAAIETEGSEFQLAGEPDLLLMSLEGFTTSHENNYERVKLSAVPAKKLYEMPVLATWPGGAAAAITEARLRNFAGMYLERSAMAKNPTFVSRLSPLPGKPGVAVVAKLPCASPWRVIMLADRAGQLVESNLLLCLNDPPQGDFSWLKPGKTSFPWWNGTIEHGPPSTPKVNFEINKKFIDFCSENKITYHSISSVSGDRPWYVQRESGFARPHPDTDILTPRPDIDLPRILDYAKEKGVAIRLWVHWKPLSEHLEEALAKYEEWGIAGLMVDFMDRDDQEMVEWQERCLQVAARHHLHIQFHGSYKPTGEERTYPNLFNREGVLNLEYAKWSKLCDPQHSVNVAYARGLTGLTDFHLGGFRAVPREKFQPVDEKPVVMGSRCNQLALYVVYENPMPMVADVPEAYKGQRGFEFVREVPTTWDETRYVAGEPGEYLIVARRSGRDWYLGGINNWATRNEYIPLRTFLGEGEFSARVYKDKSLDGREPNKLDEERRDVTKSDGLSITMAAGGGVAAIFKAK